METGKYGSLMVIEAWTLASIYIATVVGHISQIFLSHFCDLSNELCPSLFFTSCNPFYLLLLVKRRKVTD